MKRFGIAGIITVAVSFGACNTKSEVKRPNILFAIGDDITWKHMGAYGCKWVETPAFDRVAKEGILFTNAYTSNAKCAPSRASILTGRNTWQLEEACNHMPYFPDKFKTYAEVLGENGYHVGYTGKGYSPGVVSKGRSLPGKNYGKLKVKPPTTEIANDDYYGNFEQFLAEKPEEQPFCFWFGSHEPHRAYEFRSAIRLTNKKVSDIDSVPAFWPDNDDVRADMLDYAFEIEYFDKQLQKMLQKLEEMGELEKTIVVVTADNGMPFPRVKGQEYEWSNHLPLAIMWVKKLKKPGRVVNDYVNFADFAPTFLDVAGIDGEKNGMQPMIGKSLTDLIFSQKEGNITDYRNHMLIGKERHDVGRPNDQGYPIRGIVKGDFLFIKNYETDRWPAGDPVTGYLNFDGSPTKTEILKSRSQMPNAEYWKGSFGKRYGEDLYKISTDRECVTNLINEPAYSGIAERLKAEMESELLTQGDPRMSGNGDVFDNYPVAFSNLRNFYNRYMSGEKLQANWVNDSDFENITE